MFVGRLSLTLVGTPVFVVHSEDLLVLLVALDILAVSSPVDGRTIPPFSERATDGPVVWDSGEDSVMMGLILGLEICK